MAYVEFWAALGLLCAISPEQRCPQTMDISPRCSGIFQQNGPHSSSFSHWSWLEAMSRTCLDHLPLLPGEGLNCELPQQCREEAGCPAALGHSLPSKPTCGRGWVKTLIAVLWRVEWACMEQAVVGNLRSHAAATGPPRPVTEDSLHGSKSPREKTRVPSIIYILRVRWQVTIGRAAPASSSWFSLPESCLTKIVSSSDSRWDKEI